MTTTDLILIVANSGNLALLARVVYDLGSIKTLVKEHERRLNQHDKRSINT